MIDLEEGRNTSQLQYVLKLAHSTDVVEQQKAAIELAKMVEGSVFPALSFGPLAHALCRLLPSENRTVAFYAARAVKILLLDDALRGQALAVGIPSVLVTAVRQWEEEVPNLREILCGLQTLTWDKHAVAQVVEADGMSPLLSLLRTRDSELATLTTAVIANATAACDTLFLTTQELVTVVTAAIPALLELAQSRDRMQRVYATAALSNASAHPVLAGKIKELGGVDVIRAIEAQNKRTLSFGGTRIAECAETALVRLTGEGDPRMATKKYAFKYGNLPVMELSFDPTRNRVRLVVCLVLWLGLMLFLLRPIVKLGSGIS